MDKFLICKACEAELDNFENLVSHVKKSHNLNIKNYLKKFDPKYDLLDGSLIEFKSYDQYTQTDFSNKKNLKLWFSGLSAQDKISYMSRKIKQFLSVKNSTKAPSYVESVLINNLLSVRNIEQMCNMDFNKFCDLTKIECSYDYSITENDVNYFDIDSIIIDTREQKPFNFKNIKLENSKLEYGDYAAKNNHKISIERKCYSDFISTFSSGMKRFEKELERAKADGGYLVVVCESTLNNVLYSKYKRFGVASPHFISHNLRKLLRYNDNIQYVFCTNRKEAESRSLQILKMGNIVKNIDLQYYFNYGINNR